MSPGVATTLRELSPGDLAAVVRIDGLHTGEPNRGYWEAVFDDYLRGKPALPSFGLGAFDGDRLLGYVFGAVRAIEFGSEPCGWVFAVGVDPAMSRQGIARALLGEAVRRFRAAGVDTVRTMVRRNDVPVLSFFRAGGFVGGAFVQLELDCSEGTP